MLFGDRLALPWYRTVFTNIADVVSPETGPPLELTARPVDVGELLGDELSHGWWTSLADSLRDRLSPDSLPALQLTSRPIPAYGAKAWLQVMDWSSLLATPKIFLPDKRREAVGLAALDNSGPAATGDLPARKSSHELLAVQLQFKRDLSRSRFRQKIWVSLVAAEVIMLISYLVRAH